MPITRTRLHNHQSNKAESLQVIQVNFWKNRFSLRMSSTVTESRWRDLVPRVEPWMSPRVKSPGLSRVIFYPGILRSKVQDLWYSGEKPPSNSSETSCRWSIWPWWDDKSQHSSASVSNCRSFSPDVCPPVVRVGPSRRQLSFVVKTLRKEKMPPRALAFFLSMGQLSCHNNTVKGTQWL